MNSAMLPSGTSPKASVETTFLIPGAKRCSFTAMSEAAMSREVATLNASSTIVLSSPLPSAPTGSAVAWMQIRCR